jgi:hypothetical protein
MLAERPRPDLPHEQALSHTSISKHAGLVISCGAMDSRAHRTLGLDHGEK